ncbi:MAG TPA: hypothetical protein DEP32_14160 [Pseudomonas sp.]|nr:hypothetical protein [Pseudomonas sp.]MBB50207.1 hypothetical protein [Pseudomonadales bacterium]MBB50545.1 hypothetical protein [Pseudomonadales bacterium]MBO08849.1 hypothetical protein [Acidobacteriota bacterium]HCA25304.1 hypothetical protein [Pseudomonas sp.]|tara:strand:+ start:44081 stop:44593 length:513 start_codon:yes stop_codon:yes gene_type:complete
MLLEQNIPASRLAAQAMIDKARAAFERGEKPAPAEEKPARRPPARSVEELHASMAAAVEAKAKKRRAERDKLAEKIKPYAGELSANQLAEKFGVSTGLVRKAAGENGIDLKVAPGHRHTHVGPTPEQLREMRAQAAGGASVADAARWIGVPRGTVGYWAKKYGVQFGRQP